MLVLVPQPLPLRAVTDCVQQEEFTGASVRRLSLSAGTAFANLVSSLPDLLPVTQPPRTFQFEHQWHASYPSPLLLGQYTLIQKSVGSAETDMKIKVRRFFCIPIANKSVKGYVVSEDATSIGRRIPASGGKDSGSKPMRWTDLSL